MRFKESVLQEVFIKSDKKKKKQQKIERKEHFRSSPEKEQFLVVIYNKYCI